MSLLKEIKMPTALLLLILTSQSLASPTPHVSLSRNCCSVPRCREIPLNEQGHNVFQCFHKEICGEICQNQPRSSMRYKRMNFYVNKICRLYQCEDYVVDCRRCPDPSRANFDVYNIDFNCINCYY